MPTPITRQFLVDYFRLLKLNPDQLGLVRDRLAEVMQNSSAVAGRKSYQVRNRPYAEVIVLSVNGGFHLSEADSSPTPQVQAMSQHDR